MLDESEAAGSQQREERNLPGFPDHFLAPAGLGGSARPDVRIGAWCHAGLVSRGVDKDAVDPISVTLLYKAD